MGGKNHKPTRTFTLIGVSAWLSRSVDETRLKVLRANIVLENAVIAATESPALEGLELPSGSPGQFLGEAVDLLNQSLAELVGIDDAYSRMIEAARREGYKGSPLAGRLKEFNLGTLFSGKAILPGILNPVWEQVEDRIQRENLMATFEWERSLFVGLREPTQDLINVLKQCREIADRDGGTAFVEAIELNKVPLRTSFARVFSLWGYVDTLFLYSSLISTELFYRSEDLPGLV